MHAALSARSTILAIAAALLTGCAASSPASGDTASATTPAEASQLEHVLGDWTFIAIRESHVVEGTFLIREDVSHIDMPGFTTDTLVRNGSIGVQNDSVRWEGTLNTAMGPSRFVIGGVRDGDEMTGFAEIAAAGTYQFTATRTR